MKKIEKNEENLNSCACARCPSYNECAEGEGEKLYCSDQIKNDCQFQPNGCICPSCPIHRQFNLEKIYYCIHGPANKIG